MSQNRSPIVNAQWQIVAALLRGVLQLIGLAGFSRLVSPESFGVIAFLAVFVELVIFLADAFFGTPLIFRALITREQVVANASRAFYLALAISPLLFIFTKLARPALVGNENFIFLAIFLTGAIVHGAVASVFLAFLRRERAFAAAASLEVVSYGAGYILLGIAGVMIIGDLQGLALAMLGYRVALLVSFFLVFRSICNRSLSTFPAYEARHQLTIPIALSLQRFLNFVALKSDYIVIGGVLGSTSLGLYERAYRIVDIATEQIAGAAEKVTFVEFSRSRSSRDDSLRRLLKSLEITALVYMPASVLAFFSFPAIRLILMGTEWNAVDAVFRILAIGIPARALYKMFDSWLRGQGKFGRGVTSATIYAIGVPLLCGIGVQWGLAGAAAGVAIAIYVKFVASLLFVCLSLSISPRVVLERLVPSVILAAPAAIIGAAMEALVKGDTPRPDLDLLLETAGVFGVVVLALGLSVVSLWHTRFFALAREIGTALIAFPHPWIACGLRVFRRCLGARNL